MALTVFKTKFEKQKAKEVIYRNYKNFNEDVFKEHLKAAVTQGCETYTDFEITFLNTLDLHAPFKKKILRANHAPYITKALRKAIMRRSQLQTKYFKSRKETDYVLFKKQRNFVSRLYKKEKKKFYENLDINKLTDNKTFWKYMKPLFSSKNVSKDTITLVDGETIVTDDSAKAEKFNLFFKDAVSNLNIDENPNIINPCEFEDPVERAIEKFKFHPSILKIKEMVNVDQNFEFSNVSIDVIDLQVKKLISNKAITFKGIPTKILKGNSDVCAPILNSLVSKCFNDAIFPQKLKIADVNPAFKQPGPNAQKEKKDKTNIKNYRPISVLPVVSKIFERLMQVQISNFIENKLSNMLCGYRSGYSAQHALISLLEKWRGILDKKGFAGAVLMDLSKAFDCLNHGLLLAKLEAYGFSKNAIRLINSYLSDRWQRTKINTSFSSWSELIAGVPQGSVLGPLLFNIYLNDIFWFINETALSNFADDNTLYVCDKNLSVVIEKLENDSEIVIKWFEDNYMKLNVDKCHLLVAGRNHILQSAEIGGFQLRETDNQRLLGINIGKNLNFETHIYNICKKANIKLTAIARYSKLLSFGKLKLLINSFVESQFSYAPLTWMFYDRKVNNKINRLHERALRLLYKDDVSTFDHLLKLDDSFTIHERNIQTLAIEMFKAYKNIGPELLNDIFVKKVYTGPVLRSSKHFNPPGIKTVHFGEDSLGFFGNKIWNLIPNEIKNVDTLPVFKKMIRKWSPNKCPCRLCKTYINGVGYI